MEQLNESFICPIGFMVMTDPVVAEDGQTYERAQIQKWFERSNKSPKCGKDIGFNLRTNWLVRSLIEELR